MYPAPCHVLGTRIWAQTIVSTLIPVILVFLFYLDLYVHSRVFIEHLE